jgi:outer membrane protein assembly factor BamB
MNDPRTRRRFAAALLLAALLPPAAAEAVIPSAFGPIQALLVILPQLLVALAAAMVALFKPRTYRLLLAYLWAHKIFTAFLVGIPALLVWSPWSSGGVVAAEQAGAPWAAFRGGAQRTGAVAGASGPVARPFEAWRTVLGPTSAIDSSPAIVGNRLYVGVSNQSAFGGGSGALLCVDTETGRTAWTWDGKGELSPPLKPVFSSPAVWSEKSGEARWVVSGEGYHEDRDCRIVCLDLEPARKPGGKPRLAWSVQTTSHVESAPSIHDGKVTIGAGDDGFWCVDLETGRVLWRLEGAGHYRVEGDRAAALSELAGKTVVASGPVRREGLGARGKDDPGELVLSVREFKEHPGAPVTSSDQGRAFERTVTGRVSRKEGKLLLEVEDRFPDSESPPIGAAIGPDPVVIFGTGIGGQRVNCVDARTGALRWRAETPYPAFGAPTVAGDRVLIGVGNGNFIMSDPQPAGAVICLSLREGRLLWRADTPDTIIGAVAVLEGRGYACCRDGQVYAIELDQGRVVSRTPMGSPMVCSPAVTGDSIYVSTEAGRLLCLDRRQGTTRWVQTLSAGSMIVSSPAVAAGKVFVGTRARGLFAIAERPASADSEPPRPWLGPGGNPERNGCADDRGLPRIEGDTADLRWPTPEELQKPVTGPLWVQGDELRVPFETRTARVQARTGRAAGDAPAWAGPADSVRAHDLVFSAAGPTLACASGANGAAIWSATPETLPAHPPAISGDKVLLACAGKGDKKGFLECRKVVDGSLLWRAELDDQPLSYPVASASWVVVATADDRIAAFEISEGKAIDPVHVGGKPSIPALWKDTLVVAGEERIAAYDLAGRAWLWNYKDQDQIGTVVGQPVILNETIWAGTTKKGLAAIGVPK